RLQFADDEDRAWSGEGRFRAGSGSAGSGSAGAERFDQQARRGGREERGRALRAPAGGRKHIGVRLGGGWRNGAVALLRALIPVKRKVGGGGGNRGGQRERGERGPRPAPDSGASRGLAGASLGRLLLGDVGTQLLEFLAQLVARTFGGFGDLLRAA